MAACPDRERTGVAGAKLRDRLRRRRRAGLIAKTEIGRIEGLLATRLSNGASTLLPRLPLRMTAGFDLRNDPPQIGDAARDLLGELGYGADEIKALAAEGIISVGEDP